MLLELRRILDAQAVAEIRRLINEQPFQDGRVTAAGVAAERKSSVHLLGTEGPAASAAKIVSEALDSSAIFRSSVLPRSTTTPRFVKYGPGQSYGNHLDAPVMGDPPMRSDIAITMFLSDPGEYQGGELVIEEDSRARVIKLGSGDCVVYPASYLHRVEAVISGERVVAILWVQSLVRDPARRRVLFDLAGSLQRLDSAMVGEEVVDTLRHCELNLIRMWAEP